ncbi:MAG: Adaptive-response sensory-kinase SasA [Anaerolineales bacterium]|nr:Adaptive-response sensory-kinase SasA [Anaerolineales bacterium]
MTTRRAPSRIIPRAFPGIKPGEVEELIANCQVKAYPGGTTLCRENEIEHVFYMILEGEVKVTKLVNAAEIRLLKTLGAGDFFGEMAIIHNAPRAATVTTSSPVVTLELDKKSFDRVLEKSSSIAMAMVREISSRLRANDEMAVEDLRVRASELAQAYQKLAEEELARRDFLSNIAHELRTPLMSASGYIHLLKKGALSGEQLGSVVETIDRNVQQIVTLVNDILFLQEMDLVLSEFRPVDLGEVCRSVVERYKGQTRDKNVELLLRGDRGAYSLPGDARSLERALAALVDNAIKFSTRGGEVEIRIGTEWDRLVVAVEDHGIGIAPEALPKIFDRFYHLERHDSDLFGGIGLGLSIARQVIEQHGGTLEVESKPGAGSVFRMSFKR